MQATRFASALSIRDVADQAVEEALAALAGGLDGATPDLALVFVSHHYGPALEALGTRLKAATGARVLLGCTGETIVGGSREVESGPALALWAGVLPGTALRPFAVRAAIDETRGLVFTHMPVVRDPRRASLILLGDPFTFPMPGFLEHLNRALPGVPAVGGMASGGQGAGQNLLFLDGEVHAEGAVGIAIEGAVEVVSVVSQGCRPVGEPFVITACQGQAITKLGGRTATEAYVATLKSVTESERALLQRRPFLGLAVDARKSTFARGDFLVRGIVGIDPRRGAILVAAEDTVRPGMSVQFLIRDAASADEDLAELLHARAAARDGHGSAGSPASVGALVFSCNGRGSRMFDVPDHDITCVQRAFGHEVPAAGFFALGEIGPVGGKNFLHGFTASVALLRERE
jgi:small ligand-binding sensory domain FIST